MKILALTLQVCLIILFSSAIQILNAGESKVKFESLYSTEELKKGDGALWFMAPASNKYAFCMEMSENSKKVNRFKKPMWIHNAIEAYYQEAKTADNVELLSTPIIDVAAIVVMME